jgi:hypothetical protein
VRPAYICRPTRNCRLRADDAGGPASYRRAVSSVLDLTGLDEKGPAGAEEEAMAVITSPDAADSKVEIPQYRRRAIFAVWAAAALPMAALAWLVAPAVADRFSGEGNVPMAKALIASLTVGLVWQFILVAVLVGREQRTLRWSTIREALWLRSPRSPRSGRVGGRVWLVLIPLIVVVGAKQFIPGLPHPASRDLGSFLSSDAGQSFMSGNWVWTAPSAVATGLPTVSCSPPTTCTYRGRSRRTCSTCSSSPTRPSDTRAPGSGSPCTVSRACSLQPSSSHSCFEKAVAPMRT